MSDEEKKVVEESAKQQPEKKGNMLKLILMGVGVLVLIVAVSFVTLMLIGTDNQSASDNTEQTEQSDNTSAENTTDEHTDKNSHSQEVETTYEDDMPTEEELAEMLSEEEASIIEKIKDNMAALDYEPDMSEYTIDGLSVEDSIAELNWIEQEKSRLNEKETVLNKRQKELDALDRKVSKQIIKIEQVESTRIASLAKLYDNMESRSVAQLMANLDDETVVSILPRMKPKNASNVLSLLPARRAAKLSKQMITIAVDK